MVIKQYALTYISFFFALIVAALIYGQGITDDAYLDDSVNLNALLNIESDHGYAIGVIEGNHSGLLGRKLSMLTFVIEKLYIDNSYSGMKYTNICIHLLSGILVFWLAYLLFTKLSPRFNIFWPWFVFFLWVYSPFFVSTVLYSVQRMALLSSLFVFLSLILYIYLRQAETFSGRCFLIVLVLCCSILAILSKENGVVIIPLVIILEIYCFKSLSSWLSKSKGILCYVFCCCITVLSITYLLNLFGFLDYSYRDFSLTERLFTQARLLWFSIVQLLYPDIAIMGVIQDDIVVSNSLLNPIETVWAVFSWLCVVFFVFWFTYKGVGYPIVFGVLFFLVGHSIESTVLPLEMFFEHRNYLPAFGIFFSVAYIGSLLSRWLPLFEKTLKVLCVLLCVNICLKLSAWTEIWSDKNLLLPFTLANHPNSARANSQMAVLIAEKGDMNLALDYSKRSYELTNESKETYLSRNLVLYCLANYNSIDFKVSQWRNLVEGGINNNITLLIQAILNKQCPRFPKQDFAKFFDRLILDKGLRVTSRVIASMAKLHISMGYYELALQYIDMLITKNKDDSQAWLMKIYLMQKIDHKDGFSKAYNKLLLLEKNNKISSFNQATWSMYKEAKID